MKAKFTVSRSLMTDPGKTQSIILDGRHLASGPLDHPITVVFCNGEALVVGTPDAPETQDTPVTGTGSKPKARRRPSTEDK